jgi:hypothetical protein
VIQADFRPGLRPHRETDILFRMKLDTQVLFPLHGNLLLAGLLLRPART